MRGYVHAFELLLVGMSVERKQRKFCFLRRSQSAVTTLCVELHEMIVFYSQRVVDGGPSIPFLNPVPGYEFSHGNAASYTSMERSATPRHISAAA